MHTSTKNAMKTPTLKNTVKVRTNKHKSEPLPKTTPDDVLKNELQPAFSILDQIEKYVKIFIDTEKSRFLEFLRTETKTVIDQNNLENLDKIHNNKKDIDELKKRFNSEISSLRLELSQKYDADIASLKAEIEKLKNSKTTEIAPSEKSKKVSDLPQAVNSDDDPSLDYCDILKLFIDVWATEKRGSFTEIKVEQYELIELWNHYVSAKKVNSECSEFATIPSKEVARIIREVDLPSSHTWYYVQKDYKKGRSPLPDYNVTYRPKQKFKNKEVMF